MRSLVEYANSIWYPKRKADIEQETQLLLAWPTTAPVVKLTRQKIVIPSGIGLAAVLAVGQLCLSL